MPIKLYYFEASPPARSVLMLINALELKNVELIRINLSENEQLKDDFLKLNPTHTVPTLNDDGFSLWDSHAILQYLVDKYGKNDHQLLLYPKNFKQRTIVNQMLFFETSILFPALANAVRPMFYDNVNAIPEEKLKIIDESFEFMEKFLLKNEFLAGNDITIADICALATISTINIFYGIDKDKYFHLNMWFNKLKSLPFYQSNLKGIEKFTDMFIPLLHYSNKNLS